MTLAMSRNSGATEHPAIPRSRPMSAVDDGDWVEVSVSEFQALKRALAGVRRRLKAGCRAVADAETRLGSTNRAAANARCGKRSDILGTYNESFAIEHQILEALELYLDCLDEDEMQSHRTWDSLAPGLETLEGLRETLAVERVVLTHCGR